MASDRSDYPAILPQVQPIQAVDILQSRVRQVGKLNVTIADWLQERRRLEEQYSVGLRRLAQNKLEEIDLGIFSVPWDALTDSANTLADSHSALASKIEVDVERPLRDFTTSNRTMSGLTTMQGNLKSMAKDVDAAQTKLERVQARSESASNSRLADAQRELDETNAQWQSQAPYVFEHLQEVDETRLNNLRDVLTQFQTHEVDLVEQNRKTAEHCLNVLLQVETADEIKTFAIKAVSSQPRPQRTTGAFTTPAHGAGTFSPGMLGPSSSIPDDVSQRSGSVQEDKKKNRFSAITRMGTTFGRRNKRESKLPETMSSAEGSEKKSRPGPFSLGRRNRSKPSVPQLETSPEEEDFGAIDNASQRPSMPPQIGSEVLDMPGRHHYATPTPAGRSEIPPNINGSAMRTVNGSHQGDLADLDSPRPLRDVPEGLRSTPPEPTRDSEGYSMPPRELDPISAAQQQAEADGETALPAFNVNIRDTPVQDGVAGSDDVLATIANKLGPPVISRGGTVRGRRQANRHSVAVSTTTHNTFSPGALSEPVSSQGRSHSSDSRGLNASAPSAAVIQAPPVNTNVLSSPLSLTQSPPSAFSSDQHASSTVLPFASAMQTSPMRSESRTVAGIDQTGTDNQSIRSGRSLMSTASQSTKHPELHETGLNTSIVETVSARLENGKVVNSSVVGEIALAYNSSDFSAPVGHKNIRLENFASLEKVAPNPAFIIQSITGKDGVYAVDLSKITRTQVAFKYQIRTTESGSHAPILLTTACKTEPTQASIIVSCSLNPAFELHSHDSITLSNVAIGLTLEGAPAASCLSKPTGTFVRERNLIAWQIPQLTLAVGADPTKFLARFKTDAEASGGNVEAKWEVIGEHAAAVAGLGSGLAVSLQSQASDAKDGADPFADETMVAGATEVWKGCRGIRKLVSGTYGAK